MSLVYVGSLSLGAAVPGAAAGAAAGVAGINGALPDIEARLTALAAFAPSPGNFLSDIAMAQAMIASLQAALATGLSPPSIGVQLAIVAAMVAGLSATAAAVAANLDIVIALQAQLAVAGVHAYTYSGRADALGADLSGELVAGFPGGGPGDAAHAMILATTSSGTWSAMQSLFRVAP